MELEQKQQLLMSRTVRAFLFVLAILITVLTTSLVTANKVIHVGIDFPYSGLLACVLLYPLIDTVCEIWGKKIALQMVIIGLFCQIVMVLLLQISIYLPHAHYWHEQKQYAEILGKSLRTALAGLLALGSAQAFDVFIFQAIKHASKGRWLWLRTNVSTILGQVIDTAIFTGVLFGLSVHTMEIAYGSILLKIGFSVIMTPLVYFLVFAADRYLRHGTLAFKD